MYGLFPLFSSHFIRTVHFIPFSFRFFSAPLKHQCKYGHRNPNADRIIKQNQKEKSLTFHERSEWEREPHIAFKGKTKKSLHQIEMNVTTRAANILCSCFLLGKQQHEKCCPFYMNYASFDTANIQYACNMLHVKRNALILFYLAKFFVFSTPISYWQRLCFR